MIRMNLTGTPLKALKLQVIKELEDRLLLGLTVHRLALRTSGDADEVHEVLRELEAEGKVRSDIHRFEGERFYVTQGPAPRSARR